MPTYNYLNTKTDEVIEKTHSMDEHKKFLKKNKFYETCFTTPPIIGKERLTSRKVSQGFKDVLRKVHDETPGSTLRQNNNIDF